MTTDTEREKVVSPVRSLAQMVRNECANYRSESGGTCLFLEKRVNGRLRAQPCPVLAGERCPVPIGNKPDWFAAAVAPLAVRRPEYADAANSYAGLCGQIPSVSVHSCECGADLVGRQRLCPSCRRKHARQARRKWWREGRPDAAETPRQPAEAQTR